MARQVFGGKVVDVNRFKDMTIGEILKKDYPNLQVPPTGFMGPIWKVIRDKDAFVEGAGAKSSGASKSTARKPAAKSTASKGRAAAPAKKKSTARGR